MLDVADRALNGFGQTARLAGTRLVRLTYLDEGGISAREPKVVVAGVIVHGDKQLVPVEEHLSALIEKHIPKNDRGGFVFHATDIWSGGRFFKDKQEWPLARRLAILEDLADVPAKFGLPVAYGIVDKARTLEMVALSEPDKTMDRVFHACAFASATQLVERFFRNHFQDEFSIIIAEDRQKVRLFIKEVQAMLQGRGGHQIPPDVLGGYYELPYKHIRDTVHWAGKRESPLLQVADICAFLIRGACSKKERATPLFNRLIEVMLPPAFGKADVLQEFSSKS